MKTNTTLLFAILLFCFGKIYGQADPGSSGISFNKGNFSKGETGTLQVNIGNYSASLSSGKALTPYDATFTITIPYTFEVSGSVDFSGIALKVIVISEMKTALGSSVIVLTVPKGIPKGEHGVVVIPVRAIAEAPAILYATVKTDANLTYPPSGNATPNNDLQYAASFISGALPVTLLAFEASVENTIVNLSWSTTEETNSDRFDIERSTDGKVWRNIGTVKAGENSISKRDYHYSDGNPAYGVNYYRLKMTDHDLTFAYSRIRQIKFEDFSLSIYPNPVTEILKVNTGNWENVTNVQLINAEGRPVYNSGKFPLPTIDVRKLTSGIHIVRILRTDGSAWTGRILVAKN